MWFVIVLFLDMIACNLIGICQIQKNLRSTAWGQWSFTQQDPPKYWYLYQTTWWQIQKTFIFTFAVLIHCHSGLYGSALLEREFWRFRFLYRNVILFKRKDCNCNAMLSHSKEFNSLNEMWSVENFEFYTHVLVSIMNNLC